MTYEPRHIPSERRPVVNPTEAKATALQCMNAQPRLRPRRKPQPAMTPSALRYAEADTRWQAFLRRRARPDGRRSGRDVLDLARARRARLGRRTDAAIHGSNATPKGRYSDRELAVLGEEGKALKMKEGSWGYAILDLADLMDALAAYKQTGW